MTFIPYPRTRHYRERPPRPYPVAVKLDLAFRGLTPAADAPLGGGYHRVRFACGHETTYSWTHIRKTLRPECPVCRNQLRFR
jgi:hypothetical protein